MTGAKVTLVLRAKSTEGIHDFIPILKTVIKNIKGGYEWGKIKKMMEWKIETYGEENKNSAH